MGLFFRQRIRSRSNLNSNFKSNFPFINRRYVSRREKWEADLPVRRKAACSEPPTQGGLWQNTGARGMRCQAELLALEVVVALQAGFNDPPPER